MKALFAVGDPAQVMREMTWWQVFYALESLAGPKPEPEPTLNPLALRKYGVGVKITESPGH